jgi:hypothetical protein
MTSIVQQERSISDNNEKDANETTDTCSNEGEREAERQHQHQHHQEKEVNMENLNTNYSDTGSIADIALAVDMHMTHIISTVNSTTTNISNGSGGAGASGGTGIYCATLTTNKTTNDGTDSNRKINHRHSVSFYRTGNSTEARWSLQNSGTLMDDKLIHNKINISYLSKSNNNPQKMYRTSSLTSKTPNRESGSFNDKVIHNKMNISYLSNTPKDPTSMYRTSSLTSMTPRRESGTFNDKIVTAKFNESYLAKTKQLEEERKRKEEEVKKEKLKSFLESVGVDSTNNNNGKYLNPSEHKFSYSELKGTLSRPEGIDLTIKEEYLSDEEFLQVFKISRDQFSKLAKFKKVLLKKEVDLF